MQLKGLFFEASAWRQLLLLLLFVLTGAVLASFICIGLFALIYGFSADMFVHPMVMLCMQFFSAIGTFLLPAVGLAWFCSYNPKAYLSVGTIPTISLLGLTLISMLALSPLLSLSEVFNRQLVLPDFLAPIEAWIRRQEDAAEQLTNLFLSQKGFAAIFGNYLVIAITAGVCEEFLFRGALQRILAKWTANPHLVIWMAAILFSAFHLQFYGFLPRMLLGAFFGYLLLWSGNIWIPVFAHIANNVIALTVLSNADLSKNPYLTGELTQQDYVPYAVLTAASLVFFYFATKLLRKKLQTTEATGNK